jgi:hypothetical protein
MLIIYLFESHVIRAVYGFSYETMEITGPQMVLTMKLTTFAWNVYDGRRKVEVRSLFFREGNLAQKIFLGPGQMASHKENHKIPIPTRIPWILVSLTSCFMFFHLRQFCC